MKRYAYTYLENGKEITEYAEDYSMNCLFEFLPKKVVSRITSIREVCAINVDGEELFPILGQPVYITDHDLREFARQAFVSSGFQPVGMSIHKGANTLVEQGIVLLESVEFGHCELHRDSLLAALGEAKHQTALRSDYLYSQNLCVFDVNNFNSSFRGVLEDAISRGRQPQAEQTNG